MTATLEQAGEIEYTRARDFFDPAEHPTASVTIVGCGGIGSFTAHALAKLGIPKLTLVDFDIVEAHNIPNQLFTVEDLGENKAIALAKALAKTTNADIAPFDGKVYENGITVESCERFVRLPLSGIVISALDNMEARAWLWQQARYNPAVDLFIDGRLGGQNVVVYSAFPTQMGDVKGYEATLHTDAEGLDLPCTGRNVIDVGYAMAAIITRQVRTVLAGEEIPAIVFQDQENLTMATSEWLL